MNSGSSTEPRAWLQTRLSIRARIPAFVLEFLVEVPRLLSAALYLAENANKSDEYSLPDSGTHYMFLMRVSLGVPYRTADHWTDKSPLVQKVPVLAELTAGGGVGAFMEVRTRTLPVRDKANRRLSYSLLPEKQGAVALIR